MSDMSSLSREYASTTDFSRQMNRAVLLLKKRYLRGESEFMRSQELEDARRMAQQAVRALLHRLGGEGISDIDQEGLPEDVLLRIQERHRGESGLLHPGSDGVGPGDCQRCAAGG